jgi:hypothetical protein
MTEGSLGGPNAGVVPEMEMFPKPSADTEPPLSFADVPSCFVHWRLPAASYFATNTSLHR